MTQLAPTTQPVPAGRPVAITAICIIGVIGVGGSIFLMFSSAVQNLPSWYPALLGVSALIGLVCMIGLWMMRKWAVYAYTALFAVNQIVLLASGLWSPMAFVVPLIIVVIMFVYLSRMR
jgi:hypothetical protein